jgi:exopolysaccharide biosynthesis polyprenyl glycosylphosphotransferase
MTEPHVTLAREESATIFGSRQARLLEAISTLRDGVLRRMLAAADVLAALGVCALFAASSNISVAFWMAVYTPVWVVLAKLHGLYDRDQRALRHLTIDELPGILTWAASTAGVLVVLIRLSPGETLSVFDAARIWFLTALFSLALRSVARFIWRGLTPPERTLIVGSGSLASAVRRKLELFPDTHAVVVGEVHESRIDELFAMSADVQGCDRIILAATEVDEYEIASLLAVCRRHHMKLSVVPPVRGMFGTAVQLRHISDMPLIEYTTWDVSRSTLMLKRVVDVVLASAGLLILAPVFVAVAVAVAVDSGFPILFVQLRAGIEGRPFPMFKFRTMVRTAEQMLADLVPFHDLDEPMFKLANDPRVTRIGSFLRRTSLDELPQLINVLLGHMSLVGPRPEQVELVERYGPEHLFRLSVKPGITGPMQVYGRGRLDWDERLAVEREYIENLTLARDVRILAMTIPSVWGGRGAY